MFGQGSELTGAALRKTPLGAAAEGVEGSHLGWAAVALGGGQLTCLVLLPLPCVPVAHERAGIVLIQVQLGQHSLPAGGAQRRERAHTSHQSP